jgi:hypothetical protein
MCSFSTIVLFIIVTQTKNKQSVNDPKKEKIATRDNIAGFFAATKPL